MTTYRKAQLESQEKYSLTKGGVAVKLYSKAMAKRGYELHHAEDPEVRVWMTGEYRIMTAREVEENKRLWKKR